MKIKISKRDGLYIGSLGFDVENAPGRVTVTGVGNTKATALAKAATLAERVVSDPVMRALIPPQAMAAVRVTKGLAAAARQGPRVLRRAWGLLSPKSKRLAASLATDVQRAPGIQDVADVGWNPFRRKKKKRKARDGARPANRREMEAEADNSDEGGDEGADE